MITGPITVLRPLASGTVLPSDPVDLPGLPASLFAAAMDAWAAGLSHSPPADGPRLWRSGDFLVISGGSGVGPGSGGDPGSGGAPPVRYLHTQASPSALWTVNHNLGFLPAVSVLTVGGLAMIAGTQHLSVNTLTIALDDPMSGQAICA